MNEKLLTPEAIWEKIKNDTPTRAGSAMAGHLIWIVSQEKTIERVLQMIEDDRTDVYSFKFNLRDRIRKEFKIGVSNDKGKN